MIVTILQGSMNVEEVEPDQTQLHAHEAEGAVDLTGLCDLFDTQGSIEANGDTEQLQGSSACSVSPLFTGQVLTTAHKFDCSIGSSAPIFPQYALLGMLSDALGRSTNLTDKQRNLLFSNTNEPWSTFICGSQGSGKSHTLSCLLENALLANSPAGVSQKASAGIIFHYDKFSGLSSGQICEAAYLCTSPEIEVRVLVAPTSEKRLKKQYRNLPGLPEDCRKAKVIPFYFRQAQLSIDTIMTLMAVQDTGINAPLYINVIRQMLREMALENQDEPGFSYDKFVHRLAHSQDTFTENAKAPLELRLQLLRSVLLADNQSQKTMETYEEIWDPKPGTLTIVDLSDSFINENDACALFSICLKLFMTGWQSTPRIIALDEAHKFLTTTAEAQKLTTDLIAIVRQQRHLNSRVIIATQEPTVSGEFLDLCNVSIVHRFTSPRWFNTLKDHLAAAHADSHLFETIVKLKTGQAIVFCPTAVIGADDNLLDLVVSQNRHLKVSVRKRISADGGKSITAVQKHSVTSEEGSEQHDQEVVEVKRIGNATLREIATRARDTSRLVGIAAIAQSRPENAARVADVQTTSIDYEYASSSTATVVDEDSDSDSDIPGAAVQDKRKKLVTNAIVNIPVTPRKQAFTKREAERLMYKAVQDRLRAPVKDPGGYLHSIVESIEKQHKVSKNSLWTAKFQDGKATVLGKDLIKKAVKRHYDALNVPQSARASCNKWLL